MIKLIFGSLITTFMFGLNPSVKVIPPEEIQAATKSDTLKPISITWYALDLGFTGKHR